MTTNEREEPSLVVGVGASAGGLDACKRLLANVPADTGFAFLVVLHLDPSRDSHLAEVLAVSSAIPVLQVTEPERMEADHVYVIAPNTALKVDDGVLRPGRLPEQRGGRKSIDVLFSTLAEAHGKDAVGIVLSGLGSDGAEGLRDIKAAGGVCIAQDPETAQHDSMPRNAIATGLVDAILAPGEVAGFLLDRVRQPPPERRSPHDPHGQPPPPKGASEERSSTDEGGPGFDDVLRLLATHHGLDARNYKKGTLRRRALRRLGLVPFSTWRDYLRYIEKHPEELTALYEDVLIGVTQFFRDPEQWEYLEREIVPRLLDENTGDHGSVRVWSAGCASGEEAYSLAMVFLEQLESRGSTAKLQVFATDLSHKAIAIARRGEYPETIADQVSPGRLSEFFTKQGESYHINHRIRDAVTLARHDLLTEPPFSRLDLVVCRNLFIYLEPHAQHDCIQRFHFALRPRGVLWLGNSESINRHTDLFTAVSSKCRVYRRSDVPQSAATPWSIRVPYPGALTATSTNTRTTTSISARNAGRLTRSLEHLVLERYTAACVVINEAGNVLHRFGPTVDYLAPPVGEVRLDLLSWIQDSALYAKLRPALKRALMQREAVTVRGVQVQRESGNVRVKVSIDPIPSVAPGLFLLVFEDEGRVKEPPEFEADSEAADDDEPLVRRLADQLQEAQAELQSTLEELDNANEEYRASYEELVSLNEELQSTNEELETTKEEAQSINEELLTVNRELEERNEKLRTVNADLENLLALTTIPTVFLDRQLRIRRFTPAAERVMWLVPSDIGRPVQHIQKRVEDRNLLAEAARVLEELVPVETEVRGEDGCWYLRKIVPFRAGDRIEGVCMIFYDITSQKIAAEESEEARYYAEAIVRSSRAPFIVFDNELSVVSANDIFYQTFSVARESVEGRRLHELNNGEWDIPELRELLSRAMQDKTGAQTLELEHQFARVGRRHLRLNANLLDRPSRTPLILLAIEDVTQLREAQDMALARTLELEQEHRRKDEFLAMLGHELRNPLAALVNGLSLLEHVGSNDEQLEKIHPMLVRQTRRMAVMLDQLLDISRVSTGKIQLDKQAVDIVDVATSAVEAVEPMIAASQHTLALSLPAKGTLFVCADLVRLIQAVENLVSNAVKYTDDGGTIWLTVDVDDHDMVRIRVRDTGVGIDPELLTHIFDVFTQGSQSLDRAKGGLGLGLPLVRLLVDMHGGRVEAFSEGVGKGSEFIIYLPRHHPEGKPIEREGQRSLQGLGAVSPQRVLVVDDERDAATTLAELLRMFGHETRVAYDGHSAIEAASEFSPDVVLLDLGLPDIDGYEVARQLRAQVTGHPMRVVAVTGYQREARRLREAGFDDHVIKPPGLERLAAVLAG